MENNRYLINLPAVIDFNSLTTASQKPKDIFIDRTPTKAWNFGSDGVLALYINFSGEIPFLRIELDGDFRASYAWHGSYIDSGLQKLHLSTDAGIPYYDEYWISQEMVDSGSCTSILEYNGQIYFNRGGSLYVYSDSIYQHIYTKPNTLITNIKEIDNYLYILHSGETEGYLYFYSGDGTPAEYTLTSLPFPTDIILFDNYFYIFGQNSLLYPAYAKGDYPDDIYYVDYLLNDTGVVSSATAFDDFIALTYFMYEETNGIPLTRFGTLQEDTYVGTASKTFEVIGAEKINNNLCFYSKNYSLSTNTNKQLYSWDKYSSQAYNLDNSSINPALIKSKGKTISTLSYGRPTELTNNPYMYIDILEPTFGNSCRIWLDDQVTDTNYFNHLGGFHIMDPINIYVSRDGGETYYKKSLTYETNKAYTTFPDNCTNIIITGDSVYGSLDNITLVPLPNILGYSGDDNIYNDHIIITFNSGDVQTIYFTGEYLFNRIEMYPDPRYPGSLQIKYGKDLANYYIETATLVGISGDKLYFETMPTQAYFWDILIPDINYIDRRFRVIDYDIPAKCITIDEPYYYLFSGDYSLQSYYIPICDITNGTYWPTCVIKSYSDGNIKTNLLVNPFLTTDIFNFVGLNLTYPLGGEETSVGASFYITWDWVGLSVIDIYYSTNGGVDYTLIEENVDVTPGTYEWIVPSVDSDDCRIKITSETLSSESPASFRILQPLLAITAPNGGESWLESTEESITWTANDVITVALYYSINSGADWTEIDTAIDATDESYPWTVSSENSTECLIKIEQEIEGGGGGGITDESDAIFEIYTGYLDLLAPDGGEVLDAKDTFNIVWDSRGLTNVKLQYKTSMMWTTIIASVDASLETYEWTVPNVDSTTVLVKISDADGGPLYDQSTSNFTIQYTLTLTAPNGGETWTAGDEEDITWTCTGINFVDLYYSDDEGANWYEIELNVAAGTGTYAWTVPKVSSGICLVKIKDHDGSKTDQSDATFTIEYYIEVTAPNGGETYEADTQEDITWGSAGVTLVDLYYRTDPEIGWLLIDSEIDATLGVYEWTIPKVNSATVLVKIEDSDGSAVDVSDLTFTIEYYVSITAPDGGETWYSENHEDITYDYKGISFIDLYYSTNAGSDWTTIEENVAVAGTYDWTIPNITSDDCLVKIEDHDGDASDESSMTFTITQFLGILIPEGEEEWEIGGVETITWAESGEETMDMYLSIDGGSTWSLISGDMDATTGSYDWTVSDDESEHCKIMISGDENVYDISEEFTIKITKSLELTAPNGGESWTSGAEEDITWTSNGITSVDLYYSIDNGSNWTLIDESIDADLGTYGWTVPVAISAICLVKIIEHGEALEDQSDAVFTIDIGAYVLAYVESDSPLVWKDEYGRIADGNITLQGLGHSLGNDSHGSNNADVFPNAGDKVVRVATANCGPLNELGANTGFAFMMKMKGSATQLSAYAPYYTALTKGYYFEVNALSPLNVVVYIGGATKTASSGGTLAANTWYFLYGEHNPTDDKIYSKVYSVTGSLLNSGSVATGGGDYSVPSTNFELHAYVANMVGSHFVYWNKVPSATEIASAITWCNTY